MSKSLLAAALFATLIGSPAKAAIAYTGLSISETYQQTTSGLSQINSVLGYALNTVGPNDFTSATVIGPGHSAPLSLNYGQILVRDGTYRAGSLGETYSNTAALNAANPFGTYTYTATNAVTGASQTSSLLYDSNHWPSTPPAFTSGSLGSLNGLNAANPFTFEFNNFTADGFNPFPGGALNPATSLLIFSSAGTTVYNSGTLAPTTTSFTLPGGILESGADYFAALAFGNTRHAPPSSVEGYFLGFQQLTYTGFTTAAGPSAPVTLANIDGGTPANPLPLPVVGRIGQLTGTIGDAGATDYFQFFWSGGNFQANASLIGADPKSSFQFQLYDNDSNLLQDLHLDASNGFFGNMSQSLPRGLFTVGLLANQFIDPEFTITFVTPVEGAGAIPEPSTWAMLIIGFAGMGSALRVKRRQAPAGGPRPDGLGGAQPPPPASPPIRLTLGIPSNVLPRVTLRAPGGVTPSLARGA